MKTYFELVREKFNTCLWINNPTPSMGREAIKDGAIACTTNPTYLSKLIGSECEENLKKAIAALPADISGDDAVVALQGELIGQLAEVFEPLYEQNPGRYGFVSIQGNPYRDDDNDYVLEEALRYAAVRKNIIPKIPVVPAGLYAIGELTKRGIPTIATEVMSVAQAKAAVEVYENAKKESGKNPHMFLTHITGIFDEVLQNEVKANNIDVSESALKNAGTYVAYRELEYLKNCGTTAIVLGGGARKPHHFTNFTGVSMDITINPDTSKDILASNLPAESGVIPVNQAEIDELMEKLPTFRKAYLEDGLKPEEYAEYAPVDYFRSSFVRGWDKVKQLIGKE